MPKHAASLEAIWPLLANEGYEITSVQTYKYNCIAFAADDESKWWWPDEDGIGAWPAGIAREETIGCFVSAYATLGYAVCSSDKVEEGFEKIAIYAINGVPTHAAKQKPTGKWKSKLGRLEDIEHDTLNALDGSEYGKAEILMRRAVS